MTVSVLQAHLQRIRGADAVDLADVRAVLESTAESDIAALFETADRIRQASVGDGVLLRGIVEFGNGCRNTCLYCGLNRQNVRLARYRLAEAEILAAVESIHRAGLKTVVLQSGEEDNLDAQSLAHTIGKIKSRWDVAVTLSVGEQSRSSYRCWREAGADRYLLKIETSDRRLYAELHPGMSFENRVQCLSDLRDLGYQTGSGTLVGLPGQTAESLAGDIAFLKAGEFDMVSVSPFIPHASTPLATGPAGDLMMTLKMIALARIVSPDAHMPASTAIGSLGGRDERPRALAAGANVIMPNFTPQQVRSLYEIYPGKLGRDLSPERSIAVIEQIVGDAGRWIDYSRGDSPRAPSGGHLARTKSN